MSNKTAYLAGSMEYSDDAGLGWRLKAREVLAPLGITCIIPNEEEDKFMVDQATYKALKTTDLSEYLRITRAYMRQDLEFTKDCAYFICNYEGERIHGTTGEAQYRWQNGKESYLITKTKVEDIPGWFLASFSHMFYSVEQLADWLEKKED